MAFINFILISASGFCSCTYVFHVIFCLSNILTHLRDAVTSLWSNRRSSTTMKSQGHIQVTSLFLCTGKENRQKMWGELSSGTVFKFNFFLFLFSLSRSRALCQNHWNRPGKVAQTPALTRRTLSVDLGCMKLCPKFFCKSKIFHRSDYSELKMGEQSSGYGFPIAFLQNFSWFVICCDSFQVFSWHGLKICRQKNPWVFA